ncbi:hypothetical protein, partial [Marivita hallyeonensis]|uniref:hypothetical protein n=1 Tax=Marivita hallyeonensis TaxID=996342 RepID=UPI001C4A2CF3
MLKGRAAPCRAVNDPHFDTFRQIMFFECSERKIAPPKQVVWYRHRRTKTFDLGEKLDLLHLVLDLRELSQPAVIAVKGSVF